MKRYTKIEKPLSTHIKKKRERTLPPKKKNKIRNERGDITTNYTEIQRIVRNKYEQLYAKKLENQGEMDRFLEKYNLPKLNEEVESLNRSISADEIEAAIKKLLAHESPGLDGLRRILQNICVWCKEELNPILLRLFQKIQEEGRHTNSFDEASIILIPKPDKDTTKKENIQTTFTDEHRC